MDDTMDLTERCGVCYCEYGAHYTTHDGEYSGCSDCIDGCEGFMHKETE